MELHVEEVAGANKSLDVVVDIFNRVNSGGTKLSQGGFGVGEDLRGMVRKAEAQMKAKLAGWEEAGYSFSRDWLLRSINTVLTGEAQFHHLHGKSATEIEDGLARAAKHIDTCLNHIGGAPGPGP